MAYNTTTQTTGNLRLDRWVTPEERALSFARRCADRFAIAEGVAELDGPDFELITYEPAAADLFELPTSCCRRCDLHEDFGGCLRLEGLAPW